MDERFQTVYLRLWVQVKELGLEEDGFPPFQMEPGLIFFLLPFVGPRMEVLLNGSGARSQH
jgi:hypothetical protein